MMRPNDAALYDVAIVGYGPVGATFANLLAQYGLKILVVEQAAGIYDKPRAITIDHEVLRVFQACGLDDTIAAHTVPHPGTHYLGVDRQIIKVFDPMPPPYPLGWTPTATFVQPEFETALRKKFAEYCNADVLLSTQAVDVSQNDEAVSLTVRNESDNRRVLRTRYLVGCDGANSFIRKKLDIAFDDLSFDEWWMVVDAFDHGATKRPEKCFQYCWPSRPGTFLPGPGALRRWEIKLLPGEDPTEFGQRDNVLKVLAAFTEPSQLEIWRSAVYRFHALLAQSWQSGRILLMGDALHQTPPFLGQGLSAGIRDAVNLAWKLGMVIGGQADPSLLASYEIERKPHVRAIVSTAKEFGKIIGELDPVAALARDKRLREELQSGQTQTIRQKYIPDLAAGLIAPGAKLGGALFVQPSIRRTDGQIVRLDDLLRPGFAIVAASLEPLSWLSLDSLRRWHDFGGEQVVIANRMSVKKPEGILALTEQGDLFSEWLRSNNVSVVVVRPDRYVFGGADNADQLNDLVQDIACRLATN